MNGKIELNKKRDRKVNKKMINNKISSTIISNAINKVSESIEDDDDESKSSKDDNSKYINDQHKVDEDMNSNNKDIEMNANEDNKDNIIFKNFYSSEI